jgi:predicted polyphosphate/ATP-dependent NAD kinase
MKLGFIINPMAGIGGKVALKGSDGEAIVEQALLKGAVPQAGERALTAVRKLADLPVDAVFTVAGDMGANVLDKANLNYEPVFEPSSTRTTATDTREAVLQLCARSIDLLVFAGGDGTARDVLDAIKECNLEEQLPVIGIPAGCKIHSAVYAVSPTQAGELLASLVQGEPMSVKKAEVMDLDEAAYRSGQVKASCYGYLLVPVDDTRMQAVKQGGINNEALALQDIAADIVETMEDDTLYFVGAGTTTAAVMEELGLPNTLLGVDVVLNHELIDSDVDEKTLLSFLDGKPAKIVVTAIGGQGHVFGRGNQQFSPKVIEKVDVDNIIIIATNEKLHSLQGRPLLVDTGDAQLDEALRGVKQIVSGFEQRTLYQVK